MLNAYRKTIAAVFGAAGTWCLAALPDGQVTTMEWVALGIAVATALGVYAAPNATVARPKAQEHGYGIVEVLLIVLLILVILILVGALR